jgi:hypothetical protein
MTSCTYGDYDGSFDSAGLESAVSDAGGDAAVGPPVSKSVVPDQDVVLQTADAVFDVTILKGTFSAATTVTITQLPDRTLDTGLIVPVYTVTAGTEEPKRPIQIIFHGSSNNGPGGSVDVIPAIQGADAAYTTLRVVGVGNVRTQTSTNGGVNVYPFWGITKKLGTFSLVATTSAPQPKFIDGVPNACTSCCVVNAMMGNSFNGAAYAGSCVCAGATDPNPECFIKNCSDPEAAGARCGQLEQIAATSISCKPASCNGCMGGGGGCPAQCQGGNVACGSSACCVDKSNTAQPGNCFGTIGPTTTTCGGFIARCEKKADCKTGECCVVGNETLCVDKCPDAQRLCSEDTDCAGLDAGTPDGGCQKATNKYCPFYTCGDPPAACK